MLAIFIFSHSSVTELYCFQFYQEVEEAEYWMNTTLSRIHLSFDKSKLLGNRSDAESILQEIKV